MRRVIPLLVLLITACSPSASSAPVPIAVNTATPNMQVAETSTATPVPIPDREKYVLNTTIDYDLHRVDVEETIIYPNQTGQQLNSLTLAIAANLWADCFHLAEIKVNNEAILNYTLDLHRLDIPLQISLAPDSVSTVTLRYHLLLPYMDQLHSYRARIFGYSEIQMNLTNWYPFIVPYTNGEWIIHEP